MMAAAVVTRILEMPNTNPLTITPEAIDDETKRVTVIPWTDFAFCILVELEELVLI